MFRNTRSFAIAFTLASLFLSVSASAEESDSDSPTSISDASWIIESVVNPDLVDRQKLDTMDPATFATLYQAEMRRIEGSQSVYQNACDNPENPPAGEMVRACSALNDHIVAEITTLELARYYFEVERPLRENTAARNAHLDHARQEAEAKGGSADYTDDGPVVRRDPATGDTALGVLVFATPGHGLGTREEFVNRCASAPDIWKDTYAQGKAWHNDARDLAARTPILAREVEKTRPDLTEAVPAFRPGLTHLTDVAANISNRLPSSEVAGQIETRRALQDTSVESCEDVYRFATMSHTAAEEIVLAASAAAIMPTALMAAGEGGDKKAAEERWGFLNRLAGNHLLLPTGTR